ncbi:hypothetical protein CVT26_002346 [Gymnopilus dilepis]|uniref:Phosphatidylglycerol/phosphatidylinositol transfer protein n=1 Tax=Gymnopilus dilepis TaxID=231916 RepID=A0A409Y3N4_9AGAR|nr:hypothetical protein CVT26_002346 [Gymnopilus dilepis]
MQLLPPLLSPALLVEMRFVHLTVVFFGITTSSIAALVQQEPIIDADSLVRNGQGWDWKDCGQDTDAVRIQSIDISPDPPKPGKDLTVTVTGIAKERIEEGAYVDVTVKLGLVKILSKEFDVCEEAQNANASIQCPVEEGTYTVKQTVELPKEIPPGKYSLENHYYQ